MDCQSVTSPGGGEARDPLIHGDYLGSAPSSPGRARGPHVPLSGRAIGDTCGILALAGSAWVHKSPLPLVARGTCQWQKCADEDSRYLSRNIKRDCEQELSSLYGLLLGPGTPHTATLDRCRTKDSNDTSESRMSSSVSVVFSATAKNPRSGVLFLWLHP